MINRLYAIAIKEFRQIRRDPRTVIIIFFFPVLMLVLFGYAVNFDVDHIKLGVYDEDMSPLSREYIKSLESSGYFDIVTYIDNPKEINKLLDEKTVQCAVVFPNDLSEKFYANENVKIQYLIDGVNGNTATVIMNYVNAATRDLSSKYMTETLARSGLNSYQPIDLQPIFWFNPDLKTSEFMIPGLVASILITLSVVLTAVSIVREKELGTIEQINVSPVSAIELLLGKILPYTLLSLLVAALIIISGHFVFQVQIKGNIFLLFISVLLYLFASLNLGIFVSTIAESQQVAFQMGILISQLPSNLLSGFIFPIESMPKLVQYLTNITPAKFFLTILRAILIKGVGLEAFWDQLIYLFIFGLILLILASIRVRRQRI
ncbi:MAG: ABC transporter permease [Ignavibacteria bacterium]|jgi:ABC-2 type transport system permease protein